MRVEKKAGNDVTVEAVLRLPPHHPLHRRQGEQGSLIEDWDRVQLISGPNLLLLLYRVSGDIGELEGDTT
jgi:hypothetical protein